MRSPYRRAFESHLKSRRSPAGGDGSSVRDASSCVKNDLRVPYHDYLITLGVRVRGLAPPRLARPSHNNISPFDLVWVKTRSSSLTSRRIGNLNAFATGADAINRVRSRCLVSARTFRGDDINLTVSICRRKRRRRPLTKSVRSSTIFTCSSIVLRRIVLLKRRTSLRQVVLFHTGSNLLSPVGVSLHYPIEDGHRETPTQEWDE